MSAYPVTFDIDRPLSMSRAHVFLRLVILVLLSWIGASGSWPGIFYLGFPVVAAVLIAQKGGERYLTEDGDRVTRWIAFVVGFIAYLSLLTDRFPESAQQTIRLEVLRSGSPTMGSSLLRILKVIPSVFVLFLLGIVGWFVWIIAALSILMNERYPTSLWNFERGIVRWDARLLGYLASLVDPYPPFSFQTGPAGEDPSR